LKLYAPLAVISTEQDAGVEIHWLGEQGKEMEEELCGGQDVTFGEHSEMEGVDESE
jgi:hypothetical protein